MSAFPSGDPRPRSIASITSEHEARGAARVATVRCEGQRAHEAAPDADLAAVLAAYTRQGLPRTMDVARRAERIGRLSTWRSRPACALRDAATTATARPAPDLAPRVLHGIADRRPPAAP
ncbi:hypothetical protein [Streptomyces sp. CT34]|uniref:hypothetical protein n=1 Tax=Streptomyces sp. CT34 TaxID=1553907 RepID=UPI001F516F28|nr:hypothetical protein [Streptomyces sp. CT34]